MSGTMTILDSPAKVYEYNGIPEERAGVKAEFERLMGTGMYLAFATTGVKEGKPTRTQITEFPKEDAEVLLTPRLQGG